MARLENYRHPDRFGEWLGYRAVRVDRRKHRATTALKLRRDHLSPAGRVHGGVISAFLDYSCGAAVFTTLGPKDFSSTVELKVNFLQALDVGDQLRAETRVIFRGKRLAVMHSFVYREGERAPVAMATATFNIISANAVKTAPVEFRRPRSSGQSAGTSRVSRPRSGGPDKRSAR